MEEGRESWRETGRKVERKEDWGKEGESRKEGGHRKEGKEGRKEGK